MTSVVELQGVSFSYGAVEILHAIDLAVEDGEFLVVLGPSGSGKTTILRLIGGFLAPSGGRITLDGTDIAHVPINRRPFNTVFQDYALFPHMTAEENVGYGLTVRGVRKADISKRVKETLDLVALGDFGGRYPAQLSGGQQQRVALARAIICEPRLILLDEPLGALDAELRRQMQRFLKHLQREIRTTFLFITHDQEEAVTMADRICVMRAGRIEQIGTPGEVYYFPNSEYVARFFGDNNVVAGRMRSARWRTDGGNAARPVSGRTADGRAPGTAIRHDGRPARGDPHRAARRRLEPDARPCPRGELHRPGHADPGRSACPGGPAAADGEAREQRRWAGRVGRPRNRDRLGEPRHPSGARLMADDAIVASRQDTGERAMRAGLTAVAYGAPLLFILVPLLLFLLQSFFYVENTEIVHSFTLANYVRFFSEATFIPIFFYTCLLSLGAVADHGRAGLSGGALAREPHGPAQIRADAGLRDPAPDELHHEDLRDPQPARRQRLFLNQMAKIFEAHWLAALAFIGTRRPRVPADPI